MPTRILGISAFYHDSAAVLVEDGRIVAAAQEERFTRKKHDAAFRPHAVEYCLREAGITTADSNYVAFYEKPLVKFERLLTTYVACAPRGLRSYLMAMPVWLGEKLWMGDALRDSLPATAARSCSASTTNRTPPPPSIPPRSRRRRSSPSTASANGRPPRSASAAATTSSCSCEQRFPHSLGLLYSAFTYFTGFKVNSGEYKVMGLAPTASRSTSRRSRIISSRSATTAACG